MLINARFVGIKNGGNYTTLDAFLNRRKVVALPFRETSVVGFSGVNVMLLNSTLTVATTLAIGSGTTESAGLFATLLPGAVGTGSIATTSDSLGNILNMVRLRDATSHDPITEAGGKEVFGLIQAVSTAVDGDAIGGVGSENIQMSTAYVAADGTITLTAVTATVEFSQNNVYLERDIPTIMMEGGNPDADALLVNAVSATQGHYVVTTAFTAAEVITLSTGDGATGVSTKTGDTISLGIDANAFNNNNLLDVYLNGVKLKKGSDVIWDSAATFHFVLALDIADEFEVRLIA